MSTSSRDIYIKLCQIMIRDGTDQCRAALKRYGSKKQFRLHTTSNSLRKKEWKEIIENLDLMFDQLDRDVDSVVREARMLCEIAVNEGLYNVSKDSDENNDSLSVDRGESDKDDFQASTSISSKQINLHPHANIVRNIQNTAGREFSGPKHQTRKRRKSTSRTEKSKHKMNPSMAEKVQTNRHTRKRNKREQDMIFRSDRRKKKRGKHQTRMVNASITNMFENSILLDKPKTLKTSRNIRYGGNIRIAAEETESHSTDSESSVGLFITEERLFNDLITKDKRQQPSESISNIDSLTINEVCDKLSVTYSTNEKLSIELLQQLPLLLENPHVLEGNAHYVSVLVFETLLRLF